MSDHASYDEIARDITVAWLSQPRASHLFTKQEAADAYKLILNAVQNPFDTEKDK